MEGRGREKAKEVLFCLSSSLFVPRPSERKVLCGSLGSRKKAPKKKREG